MPARERDSATRARHQRAGVGPREKASDVIFEQGSGTPLLLIPGIQGRWEYMQPAIGALSSASFRVITFPLCGERASGAGFDRARGIANDVAQAASALDRCGVDRAIICGIS